MFDSLKHLRSMWDRFKHFLSLFEIFTNETRQCIIIHYICNINLSLIFYILHFDFVRQFQHFIFLKIIGLNIPYRQQKLMLVIVKTHRNSTQLNSTKATQKQLRWVRHSTHLEPTHTTHTTINFSVPSRRARELKFGTETHQTSLIKQPTNLTYLT